MKKKYNDSLLSVFSYYIGCYIIFVFSLLTNFKDLFKIFKIDSKKKNIAFYLEEPYFLPNYLPILDKLRPKEIIYIVHPFVRGVDYKSNLIKYGIKEDNILSESYAIIAKWFAVIFCAFPSSEPNFSICRSKYKIHMHHGAGVYPLMSRNRDFRSYRYSLMNNRFNVQFLPGPEYFNLDSFSPNSKIYKTGYAKIDFLVENIKDPNISKELEKFDKKKILLYTPHHSEFQSLDSFGLEFLFEALKAEYNIIIKFHERILHHHKLKPLYEIVKNLSKTNNSLILGSDSDTSKYYPFADVVLTDLGSSSAFEALVSNKTIIIIRNKKWESKYTLDDNQKELISFINTIEKPLDLLSVIENTKKIDSTNRISILEKTYYNLGHASEEIVSILESL
jgi:hypothetical protein